MLFFSHSTHAQTFDTAYIDPAGDIPDGSSLSTSYPIEVSGVGIINSSYGVANICIDITHPWVGDLEIFIQAPDGTKVPLSIQNGGSGDNFTGTCFNGVAPIPIRNGKAPFSGEYTPDGALSNLNNGQNADGQWALLIRDIWEFGTGKINSWNITFNNTPAPPPPNIPTCMSNPPAGNTCTNATSVCNFNGYCGSTPSPPNPPNPPNIPYSWPELELVFIDNDGDKLGIENNLFIKFIASASKAAFNIWVQNCNSNMGIQILFFSTTSCGSGAVDSHGCYPQIFPTVAYPYFIEAKNLIPGNEYYIMFDGFSGDVCNYTIEPVSGVNVLSIKASPKTVCKGQPIKLDASGSTGTYTWSGPNLMNTSGSSVTAYPTENTTYSVTLDDPIGKCSLSQDIDIKVNQNPILGNNQNDTICKGKPIDITKKFITTLLNVEWTKDGLPVTFPEMVKDSGLYRIEAENLLSCKDTAYLHIAFQKALIAFAGNDTIAVRNAPHQLIATGGETYEWSPRGPLNSDAIFNPVAILNNDQQFIVTVSNSRGCSAKDTVFVKVYDGPTYYVPKAFSPNGDGVNDIFRPVPVGIANTSTFNIYNRMGTLIYSGNKWLKGWNGFYNGKPQPAGSYVWMIEGIDKNGKKINLKGSVLLIR